MVFQVALTASQQSPHETAQGEHRHYQPLQKHKVVLPPRECYPPEGQIHQPHQYGALCYVFRAAGCTARLVAVIANAVGEVEGLSKATHLLHAIDDPV